MSIASSGHFVLSICWDSRCKRKFLHRDTHKSAHVFLSHKFSLCIYICSLLPRSLICRLTNEPDGANLACAIFIHRASSLPFGIEGPILLDVAVPVAVLPSDPFAVDRWTVPFGVSRGLNFVCVIVCGFFMPDWRLYSPKIYIYCYRMKIFTVDRGKGKAGIMSNVELNRLENMNIYL